MNPRTRILLILAGTMATLWLCDLGYRELIENPAQRRELEITKLQNNIRTAKTKMAEAAPAKDSMAMLEQASLPYDPELARSGYQDWLLGVLKTLDFQQTSIDAGSPASLTVKDIQTKKAKEFAKKYAFSVRGRGSLPQITQFLYEFHRSPHLHKIRSISLNPVQGGQFLDVAISIEALGLTRCERPAALAQGESNRLDSKLMHDYQIIARRNLFAEDGDAALRQTVLTAVTVDKTGQPGAWFSQGESAPTQVVHCGEHLIVADHEIEILDIQPHRVVIDMDGLVVSLPLGKSIHDAVSTVTDGVSLTAKMTLP